MASGRLGYQPMNRLAAVHRCPRPLGRIVPFDVPGVLPDQSHVESRPPAPPRGANLGAPCSVLRGTSAKPGAMTVAGLHELPVRCRAHVPDTRGGCFQPRLTPGLSFRASEAGCPRSGRTRNPWRSGREEGFCKERKNSSTRSPTIPEMERFVGDRGEMAGRQYGPAGPILADTTPRAACDDMFVPEATTPPARKAPRCD